MNKQRWVVKFGTGILTRPDGRLDPVQFRRLCAELTAVARSGIQTILVSSGAIGAGMRMLGLEKRPVQLAELQACSTVGQAMLIAEYEKRLSRQGMHAAQMLLTSADIDSRSRYKNARATLDHLLERGDILPIINENDALSTEEIKVGDNDRLSALVAVMAGATKLVILSNVEGLLRDPADPGTVVPVVRRLDEKIHALASGEVGRRSVGGMATKLQAAAIAAEAGIPTIIANGRRAGVLEKIAAGEPCGTLFKLPRQV
jgi:glutamate 5-kinase